MRGICHESFDRTAEVQHATAAADVVSGRIVEVGEGDGWNSHVARGGRLHRFADYLGGGGNRNQIEFLAEGADQDRAPEAVDRLSGLAVMVEPVLEGLSRVALFGK